MVSVAADGMTASACVVAGDVAGAAELHEALVLAQVSFGIDAQAVVALASSLADPTFSSVQEDVARGTLPLPGDNGWFEPTFHVGIQPGHVQSDGSIDFYDRELTKPALRQQVIGWFRPPVPGVDGRNVRGERVAPPAVTSSTLRLERGVTADPDGAVRASVDGVVVYVEGASIDVAGELVHKGNVDLRSGNLETEGSLTIRGDVLGAFSVRAAGDIVVQGRIDGGTVIAEGNIQVKGGIRGGPARSVCAQGNVKARQAELATITCGGAITLESATHCELSAQRVEVSHAIRGGRASAQASVVTHEAGAPHGSVSTTLAAAIVLDPSLRDAKRTFLAAKERRRLERQAGGALRADGGRAKGGKLGLDSAAQQREALERRVQLARSRAQLLPSAFVEVRGTAYSGVMIVLGEHRFVLDHDITSVRFSFDPGPRKIFLSPKK